MEAMLNALFLVVALVVVLAAAELFTNAVEWLGCKMHFTEGAVGSILAAVGTAMPETMIPIIAIVLGNNSAAAEEIGIGAILGAPFMLATLAMFVTGTAAVLFKYRGTYRTHMLVDREVMSRDLRFFLVVYCVAIAAAFLKWHPGKVLLAVALFASYFIFAYQTIKHGQKLEEDSELNPLYLCRRASSPHIVVIVIQLIAALGLIVGGAKLFVRSVETLSLMMHVPPFVLSVIIAPVATELPEKCNSIIWVGKGKDTLALGNITGAMVFQSSILPAIGILLTPWELTGLAVFSAVLAILSAALMYVPIALNGRISPMTLLTGGFFYLVFLCFVVYRSTANPWVFLSFAAYFVWLGLASRRPKVEIYTASSKA